MTKATITRLFLGSVVAFVAGILLAIVAFLAAVASGAFVMDGPDVVGIEPTPAAWSALGVGLIALLAVIGGSIGGLVSWIGALLNTVQIEDKTWFIVLLVLGLLSFGLVAMIAYVVGGPDGTVTQTEGQSPALT
jgi:hypothetical protein